MGTVRSTRADDLNLDSFYLTAIPNDAREDDRTGKPGGVRHKVVKNYYVGRTYVGQRIFTADGALEYECSYRNGKRHGWEYEWDSNGVLLAAVPFENGREHGIVRQWSKSGTLIGSYTMNHGSGLDLWWNEFDGKAYLTEARVVVDGLMEGCEYWFQWRDPGVLWKEKWWAGGKLHGIERQWSDSGRLVRGFPKYWIHGSRVDKRKYDRTAKRDTTLRPFCVDDNSPARVFPPEVAAHLR